MVVYRCVFINNNDVTATVGTLGEVVRGEPWKINVRKREIKKKKKNENEADKRRALDYRTFSQDYGDGGIRGDGMNETVRVIRGDETIENTRSSRLGGPQKYI